MEDIATALLVAAQAVLSTPEFLPYFVAMEKAYAGALGEEAAVERARKIAAAGRSNPKDYEGSIRPGWMIS